MKSENALYELIKAMSKSEKRYFTVDAGKGSEKESRYLELFQLYAKMNQPNEEALKQQFGSRLAFEKHYLYESIMRSMRDYKSRNSYLAQARELLLDARFLFERSLFDQCAARLKKAASIATSMGEQPLLVEITKEKRRLARTMRKGDFAKVIVPLMRQTDSATEGLSEELKYLDIYDRLSIEILKTEAAKDPKKLQELKDSFGVYFTNELLPKMDPALRRFYQSKALYSRLIGDKDAALDAFAKVIDWWESRERQIKEKMYLYVIDLSNYLNACLNYSQFERIPTLLKKLDELEPKNSNDKAMVFQKYAIFNLTYQMNTGDLFGAKPLIRRIDKGLSNHSINQSSRMVLIFNTAVLLFILGEAEEVRNWTNKLIKKEKADTNRMDIQRAVRVLHLFNLLELDDYDEAERFIRNLKRFLQQKGLDASQYEWQLLTKANAYIQATPSEERKLLEAFSTSKTVLPFGLNQLLAYWSKSKLQNSSISKLMYQ